MSIIEQSNLGFACLIQFNWGGNVARYAAYNRSIDFGGHTWAAEPQAKVDFAKQSGGATDEPIKVTMRAVPPLDAAGSEQPVPRIIVTVTELHIAADGSMESLPAYNGVVSRVRANRSGKVGLVSVDVAGWRSRLVIPLGILAGNTCSHKFGDVLCTFDVPSVTQSGTISSIVANRVVVTGVSFTADFVFRGYVAVDGLRLMVRNQFAADTFDLVQPPPPAWAGATADVIPGCDKDLHTCVNRWDNGINFGGYGLAIPTHNPATEVE